MLNQIERNLFLVDSEIKKTAKLYNIDFTKINLIAVSKKVTSDKIIQAINANCKIFGENYVNEALEKWPKIKAQYPEVKLHFIGHLQSNKTDIAVGLFDCIQTLDNEKLAKSLQKSILKMKKNIDIFIQVNIGQESQKSGVDIASIKDFIDFSKNECNLNVSGLMCIPPVNESPVMYFALMKKIAQENNIKNLSMGMSSDYSDAIALGTNFIRLGTAIFGERK